MKTTIILLLASISLSAYAQKTTNIQEAAVWAPENVKVDGKLTEWNDTFQAMNKSVQLFYTVSNDDKNLYLTIRSNTQQAGNKLVAGGLNFTINAAGKKNEDNAVIITYPAANISALSSLVAPPVRQEGYTGRPRETVDPALVAEVQRTAIEAAKEIKVKGVKEIKDSLLSIYNEYGFKGLINFDAKGNVTYELAVPLKYLHLSDGTAFAYNIKLKGIGGNSLNPIPAPLGGGGSGIPQPEPNETITRDARVITNPASSGGGGGGFTAGPGSTRPADSIGLQDMMYPTDFWGKYTLAKK
ncbi:MAG: hypothetical protein EOP47_08275 [Sphingobacteriaceae bacterium]|nr:MAG: hypothetical protein EOP47_08275 [Sphingobacteriaceae bacterium]